MATLILALLRTLDRLSWMGLFNVGLITLAGLVAMAVSGAGLILTLIVCCELQFLRISSVATVVYISCLDLAWT